MPGVPVRDVVFVVADATMQQILQGFLGRDGFHHRIGCGDFAVDARQNRDVFVAAGQNDPGLYARADELVRPHLATHRRAVVMLDADWDGSPGAAAIRTHVSALLARTWPDAGDTTVVVLEPEIEAWFWQPHSPHVAAAMHYTDERPYREVLERAGHWPADRPKPPRPKEALEYLHARHGTDFSPAVLRRAAERISVRQCQDPAFILLCETLRRWFPTES
ncbi:MAG: methylation-associated defense system protein MAD4 [Pseudonocardia sp.]